MRDWKILRRGRAILKTLLLLVGSSMGMRGPLKPTDLPHLGVTCPSFSRIPSQNSTAGAWPRVAGLFRIGFLTRTPQNGYA